jgi:ATP-dependent Clp protease protease subunit
MKEVNYLANSPSPAAPAGTVFDQLFPSRIIWLGTDVNDGMANEICAKLLLLSAKDPEKDIYIYINSPGGSITSGMAIYDTMNLIPNDVVTIGIGMAASMGQFLLSSGTKGKRFATPNLRVLLHQPSGGFGGTSDDIQTQAKLIIDMKHRLAAITAENTGHTVEEIHAAGNRDGWYNAEEALAFGFFDHIQANVNDVVISRTEKAAK